MVCKQCENLGPARGPVQPRSTALDADTVALVSQQGSAAVTPLKLLARRARAMADTAPFSDYPREFASHSRPLAPLYRMRSDCFAGVCPIAACETLHVLWSLPDEGLAVFAGAPATVKQLSKLQPRPVYGFSPDDPPALPTGKVFVQGKAGTAISVAVAALGYVLESVPPYAPHAAWLVAADGSIASALSKLEALFALPALMSVEPQMLRPVARR